MLYSMIYLEADKQQTAIALFQCARPTIVCKIGQLKNQGKTLEKHKKTSCTDIQDCSITILKNFNKIKTKSQSHKIYTIFTTMPRLSKILRFFPYRLNLLYLVSYILDRFWQILCMLFNVIEQKVYSFSKWSRTLSLKEQLLS